MMRELNVDPGEVAEVVREARRLVTFGATEAERVLYAARKQDLLDRLPVEPRAARGGEPR